MPSKTFILILALLICNAVQEETVQEKANLPHQNNEEVAPGEKSEDQIKVTSFFQGCQEEVGQWLSLPNNKSLERALWECYVPQNSTHLLNFYEDLTKIGPDLNKTHLDSLPKLFRKYKHVKNILTCLAFLRQYQNKFVTEPKKAKFMNQFAKAYPQHGKNVFPGQADYKYNGQQSCSWLKVLFQYYYLEVVSSMQTQATSFLRAFTLRSEVLDHYDLAYCVSLQSLGPLSEALQDLTINNIYIKIPDLFQQLKHLKLKQACRNQQNALLLKSLRQSLEGLDMFKIMINEHEPWVQIATQKFGHTQIRMIARQFAILTSQSSRAKYLQLSKKIDEDKIQRQGQKQEEL